MTNLNIDVFAKTYNWLLAGGDDQYKFDYTHWTYDSKGCGSTACIGGYIEASFYSHAYIPDLDTEEGYDWLGITYSEGQKLFFAENCESVDPYDMSGPEVARWMLDLLNEWYKGSKQQIADRAAELSNDTDVASKALEAA